MCTAPIKAGIHKLFLTRFQGLRIHKDLVSVRRHFHGDGRIAFEHLTANIEHIERCTFDGFHHQPCHFW